MSDSSSQRRGYHHGNLKQALISAALDLISSKGPSGFTFAEAARSAGVSPAAPYRHFRDRDELISGVALQGYEKFTASLEKAWGNGKPEPRAALMRIGQAYLEFARREPAYYSAMFESGLAATDFADLRRASDAAFDVLRQAVEALIAELPPGQRPPALMMSLHIWAFAHGIASLYGRGDKGSRPQPISPPELLESAILLYLSGLKA